MSTSIPKQHPAVVLRSQYDHLRAFLALVIAMVVALCVALVLIAVNDDATVVKAPKAVTEASLPAEPTAGGVTFGRSGGVTSPAREIQLRRSGTTVFVPGAARYDGGPEEGTRGPVSEASSPVAPRYDGGPDEGTRGLGH